MLKKYFLSLLLVSTGGLWAKPIIDCRVGTGDTVECNPYGKRFHIAGEIHYDEDTKRLIVDNTLPSPKKKILKVVSIQEMIEKYIHLDEVPQQFDTTRKKPKEIKQPLTSPLVAFKQEQVVKKVTTVPKKKKQPLVYGSYKVVSGDVLSRIANKFGMTTKEIAQFNHITETTVLRIGQKLKLPFDQTTVDAYIAGQYRVEEGDTLLSIATKFNLAPRDIVKFNKIRDATTVRKGKILKLPLGYILDRIAKTKMEEAKKRSQMSPDMIGSLGTYKLRVTATAYTSHEGQTDETPFLAAWNNRLVPGEKSIAVSRDLLSRFGMRNGTKVRISGLRGYYEVRDKMNKRYNKRIDIYMGLDVKKALKWGKRSVVIYW